MIRHAAQVLTVATVSRTQYPNPMSTPIRLGPFDLLEPLDVGGMGEIWRGIHRRTNLPVAVKMIRQDRLGEGDLELALEREVRTHAGLNHPGVVVLFDFARVTPEAADASDGRLVANSPYVVMELANRGSLRAHMPLSSWGEVKDIVFSVLKGLSHAHARDIIHRDIKPENILIFGEQAYPAKLADFGIAHAKSFEHEDEPGVLSSFMGTPLYVAPEQALGKWRRFGPWTDIYALGCVVWELVCGEAPFDGSWLEIVNQHIIGELPPFRPRMRVPDDVHGWLKFAMARAPMARFHTCADALHALPAAPEQLPPEENPPTHAEAVPTLRLDTIVSRGASTLVEDQGPTRLMTAILNDALADPDARLDALELAPTTVAFPEDWRVLEPRDHYRRLSGAGLGLFELREPRFIGRETERDAMWGALRRVLEGGGEAVFIVGGPGAGKSSLARWLTTRAEEVGAARRLEAFNTPEAPGPTDGFVGLLRRVLRAWGLTGDELHDHILSQLDATATAEDARLLTGWLGAGESTQAYPFPMPDQRHDLAQRLLVGFTQARPAVAWLDDLQWSHELAETLKHLLDVTPPLDVLFVATLRADVIASSQEIARWLAPLMEHPKVTRIELGPLPASDEEALVRELLPVTDELAARVAKRAEGNPLFARQLLRWVIEAPARGGAETAPAADVGSALPRTIQDLFERRVEDVLASLGAAHASAERAIELAAVLGRQLDRDEWTAALDIAGHRVPERLEEMLMLRGLTRPTPTGFEFEHALLVDALLARAARGERLTQHHRACARALDRAQEVPLETRLRAMEHWASAEVWEEAIELSERIVDPLVRRGNMRAARDVLRRRLGWLREAGYPKSDVRRLRTSLKLGVLNVDAIEETNANALEIAAEVLESARAGNEAGVVMKSLELLAMIAEREGRFDEALEHAREAFDATRSTGQARAECIAQVRLGWAHAHIGELDPAHHAFEAVRVFADDEHDLYLSCYAVVGLSWVALVRDQLELARRLDEELVDAARQHSWTILQTYGLIQRASRHLRSSDFDAALVNARRAGEARHEATTTSETRLTRSLEGVALAGLERFDEASACLEDLRHAYAIKRPSNEAAYLQILELAVAAGLGALRDFDAAAAWFLGPRLQRAIVRPEHPIVADWAARRWDTDPERAELARRVARLMRRRLDASG